MAARRQPMTTLLTTLIAWCFLSNKVKGFIAVNWGRQATHRLIPSMVVDLLLQNNLQHVKIFSPSDNLYRALAGGEIAITTTLPNEGLKHMLSTDDTDSWLQRRIGDYLPLNVNIKYVHVGSEPLMPDTHKNNKTFDNAVDVLALIQQVLVDKYDNKIKATIPHFTNVLVPNITKPSEAEFLPHLRQRISYQVRLLNSTDSPFIFNMFPIHYVVENNWDMEFAFIENRSNFTIYDDQTKLVYKNVFEFLYDSFLTAMSKVGGADVQLIVGQVGWPTDGYPGANITNAERFYKELLPYVTSKKGTPLRPGVSIDVYIHNLVDENSQKIPFGGFERHWGIYKSNGEPKYKIDFSGKGRDIYPSTAKGVISMPKRWCVYNGRGESMESVERELNFACENADCTALVPGGSCSHLNFTQTVSYAFNRYFQSYAQAIDNHTCEFHGLGMVVPEDPSVGTCQFPVEILSAEQVEKGGVISSYGGAKLRGFSESTMLFLLLWILFT